MTRVSIIICTRNRADSLQKTLVALSRCEVPASFVVELIVVDNGSTDHTLKVVQSAKFTAVTVRYYFERRVGQTYARNLGLEQAAGEIIIFTDDDVCPPAEWLQKMCEPILSGSADAVAGGVHLAAHLQHSFLTSFHRVWLASTETLSSEHPDRMVGANMALARHVLERVPTFDEELGPGKLGFNDDTLFAAQLAAAGYRIANRASVSVEHHFDASRLTRRSFLSLAKKMGRSHAYVAWHWEQREIQSPRRSLLKAILRLNWWRLRHLGATRGSFHCPEWEMQLLQDIHFYSGYLTESKRQRNYVRHGLRKFGNRTQHTTTSSDELAAQPTTV